MFSITIPADVDEAGWIVDYLTDPITLIKTMQRTNKRSSLTIQKPIAEMKHEQTTPQDVKHEQHQEVDTKEDSTNEVVFHDATEIIATPRKPISTQQEQHHNKPVSYDHTAVSTEEMLIRWQK